MFLQKKKKIRFIIYDLERSVPQNCPSTTEFVFLFVGSSDCLTDRSNFNLYEWNQNIIFFITSAIQSSCYTLHCKILAVFIGFSDYHIFSFGLSWEIYFKK